MVAVASCVDVGASNKENDRICNLYNLGSFINVSLSAKKKPRNQSLITAILFAIHSLGLNIL